MRYLGVQVSEDGKTLWRNNGGIIERCETYGYFPELWKPVANTPDTPRTKKQLKDYCKNAGFGYYEYKQSYIVCDSCGILISHPKTKCPDCCEDTDLYD